MSNITIFSDASTDVATYKRESKLADKMGSSGSSLRRIQLNNKGTFRRIINGEPFGKAAADAIDVIIVDLLPEVSRTFYAGTYDPDAPPTLPDCWSNLGKTPEPNVPNAQATSCDKCPKNVEGSDARGKGRACRFQRRLAVLIVGDKSGEVYQISIPAKSLFRKGVGNVHGFESYKKFLVAAGEAVDTVVTRIMYDKEVEGLEVQFQPIRHLSPDEGALVDVVQADPETEKYIQLTVAAGQGAKATAPAAPAPSIMVETTPINASAAMFADDDDEDEEVGVPPPAAPVAAAEPTKRASKKAAAPVAEKPDLTSVLGSWLSDDDED